MGFLLGWPAWWCWRQAQGLWSCGGKRSSQAGALEPEPELKEGHKFKQRREPRQRRESKHRDERLNGSGSTGAGLAGHVAQAVGAVSAADSAGCDRATLGDSRQV